MKINRAATIVLVLAMLGIGAFGLHAQAPRPAPSANPANSFDDKIVEVGYKSDPDHFETLKNVELRIFGDRRFVVGTNVQDTSRNGLEIWFSLDDVAVMTVYPSLEDWKKRMAEAPQPGPALAPAPVRPPDR